MLVEMRGDPSDARYGWVNHGYKYRRNMGINQFWAFEMFYIVHAVLCCASFSNYGVADSAA